MLSIAVNLETGQAKAVQTTTIKAGGDVPVEINFSSNPGDDPVIELALSPQSSTPAVKAYVGFFEAQNTTLYVGTLDANDTRLIDQLAGKEAQTFSVELVVTTEASRRPFPNFPITVQPPTMSGPVSTEGGPVWVSQAIGDGRYLRQGQNLADLDDVEAARENLGIISALCQELLAGPVTFDTAGSSGQYWYDAATRRVWVYLGGQFQHFPPLISAS